VLVDRAGPEYAPLCLVDRDVVDAGFTATHQPVIVELRPSLAVSHSERRAAMDDFTGKVVLVTGAGRACGRAIAEDLGRRGARVVVNDIDRDTGDETARRIAGDGGAARFVRGDVASEDDMAAVVDAALDAYGRLDGAVNNAGTELTGPVADSDRDAFATIIATNLEGMRACLKHEIRAMRADGGGAIVNMSSVTSDLTAVPGNGLYAATKGGVDALTKAAAVEVASEGIRVNALAFMAVDVEDGMFQRFFHTANVPLDQIMAAVPASRLCRADELCAAVRFLCSSEAGFMTGTTLVLDGGFTAM
jgi:NAD(P)-dependent dehydrogenase (short-subunit alcohol dehydrogenase family)